MERLKRVLARLGKALVILILALGVMHGVLSLVWGRRYEAAVDKIRARGEPVSLMDLAGKPIPDSENAAVAFGPIFKRLEERGLSRDIDVLAKVVEQSSKPITAETWSDAARVAPEFDWLAPVVSEAVSRPYCKFHVDWEKGYQAELSHYAKLRKVGWVLAAKSVVYSKQGQTGEAARWAKLGQQTAECIHDDPLIIGMLVRVALNARSTDAVNAALRYGRFTPAQAKELFDGYAGREFTGQYAEAMKGERAMALHFVEQTQSNGPLWASDMMASGSDPCGRSAFLGFLARPWTYLEGTVCIRAINETIADCGVPYRRLGPDAQDKMMQRIPRYAVLTRALLPAYGRISAEIDRNIAGVRLTQTALALAAYHEEHGAYPPSLSVLQSKLGWPIPEDPLSGGAYHYRTQGKGYLLYSIGLNLRDDGGRNELTPDERRRLRKPEPDDIAFRMDH